MDQPSSGRCYCGAVRFHFNAAPIATRMCWCRDCQYLAAGNASVNVVFPGASLDVEGATGEYFSTADSGNQMRRRFCATCGTQLFSEAMNRPDYIVVRAGALDSPELGRPQAIIWTSSAPSWAVLDPTIPHYTHHVSAIPKS